MSELRTVYCVMIPPGGEPYIASGQVKDRTEWAATLFTGIESAYRITFQELAMAGWRNTCEEAVVAWHARNDETIEQLEARIKVLRELNEFELVFRKP